MFEMYQRLMGTFKILRIFFVHQREMRFFTTFKLLEIFETFYKTFLIEKTKN